MPNYGSRYTSSMYVRGIGSRVNSPAVGIYQDGMPLVSKSAFNIHTYQLDRIDILRGPQGTLYGQNTEGGLVRLFSKNPMSDQGTDIILGVGTHLYRNVEVAHSRKLNEQVAFSVAGFYTGQNGFFRNQTTGDRSDLINEGGAKVRLVWQPSNRLTFDYLADFQHVKQNGFPYGEMDPETGKTASPSTNRQGNYRRDIFNTALTATYKASLFDVFSTTSYQYLNDKMLMDIDYLPEDYMHLTQFQLQNAVTEELVVKSRNSSSWHWSFGAFGMYQWLKTDAPVYFDNAMNAFLSKTITDYAYYGMLNSMAARMGKEAAAAMIARAGGCTIDMQMEMVPGLFHTPQANFGLFHQSDIDITPSLTATLGLRYDYNHVGIDDSTLGRVQLIEDVMGTHVEALISSVLEQKERSDFNQLLPKVGLTYRFGSSGNVYATMTKGYRAGGFNIQMFSDILQTELQGNAQSARGDLELEHTDEDYDNIRETIAFKPEVSWNYEFGTHLNLLNGSMQFDFAGFYMQVRNQQLSVMAGNYGYGRMMVNAGKSYSCGIETMLRGVTLDEHLTWALNYGYTRAVFKEYTDNVTVDGEETVVDYKNKRVPFVPEHTFSACADYRFSTGLASLRAITVGANINGLGKIYWDEANTYSQKFYATLGAHADADFGNVTVSLWGRNLMDAKHNTFAVSSAATGTTNYFAQRGNPLQIGADIRIHL